MDFIRRRIEPCAGAPVHILACGHTVSASSFVHSTKSSKCAPNCKSVDLITAAEPWFLCPTCYESAVQAQFDRFKSRFLHPSETGERVESDSRIQSNRKKGFVSERDGFAQWHVVLSGHSSVQKTVKATYKFKVENEGFRACNTINL